LFSPSNTEFSGEAGSRPGLVRCNLLFGVLDHWSLTHRDESLSRKGSGAWQAIAEATHVMMAAPPRLTTHPPVSRPGLKLQPVDSSVVPRYDDPVPAAARHYINDGLATTVHFGRPNGVRPWRRHNHRPPCPPCCHELTESLHRYVEHGPNLRAPVAERRRAQAIVAGSPGARRPSVFRASFEGYFPPWALARLLQLSEPARARGMPR
jgi:hypothetical protein